MSQESTESIDRTALELDDVGPELKNRLQYRYVQSQSSAESLQTVFSSLSLEDQHAAFSDWINENRARAYELHLSPGDVDIIFPSAETILSLATSLVTLKPDSYGSLALLGNLRENEEPSGDPSWEPAAGFVDQQMTQEPVWKLYIRSRSYRGQEGHQMLRCELEAYATRHPVRLPWDKATLQALQVAVDAGEQLSRLSYAGVTTATTLLGRLMQDLQEEHKHFSNFARVAAQTRKDNGDEPMLWELWELQSPPIPCDAVSLRVRYDLQAAERVTIGALQGLGLNSSPGGFHHIPFYADLVPPTRATFIMAEPPQPPNDTVALVRAHFDDMLRMWQDIGNSGANMSPEALEIAKEYASTLRWLPDGRSASLQVAKDITVEALHGDRSTAFYGSDADPGPTMSLYIRAWCALASGPIPRFDARWTSFVGGFVDFWSVCLNHGLVWLAVVMLARYMRIIRPIFIRVQSAQVANVFVTDKFAKTFDAGPDAAFYLERFWNCQVQSSFPSLMGCVTAQARSSEWSALTPSRWINWIGVLVVCPTGPDATSDWALVCILGHDGRIKYDPSIAEELTRLAMVSQRIAVVAEEYILDRLVSQPVQDGMIKPWLIETLAELETHLQELGIDVKLENAREAVKSMQAWLGSKRQRGAYDRMRAEAEAAGEEAEAEFAAWLSAPGAKARATDKLRHIFAAGQPRSEIRRVQWEEQLALFLEQEPRGLVPLGNCPPRPTHFDDDEAEEWWWMSRAENTDMVYSAQRVTQAAQQAADWTPARSREHYRLHFGRMVTTPPTAFQSTVGFFHALKELARDDHSDNPSRRLRVLTCAVCGESAITSHNGKHRCLTIDGVAYGDVLSSSRASGVFTKKLVHPCDLLDHPTVGLTAWKNAELEKLQSTPPSTEAEAGSATLADCMRRDGRIPSGECRWR